jgi:hypothetical protein
MLPEPIATDMTAGELRRLANQTDKPFSVYLMVQVRHNQPDKTIIPMPNLNWLRAPDDTVINCRVYDVDNRLLVYIG